MNLIPEIDTFILLNNVYALFTLSLYISFYRGSQYGLRNENSAYLNHLLHDNTDNLQELNRKGVLFFKFELNEVEETPTSVPIVLSGEYTTTIKMYGPIPLGNPKS